MKLMLKSFVNPSLPEGVNKPLPDPELFVTLAPGESFELEAELHLSVRNGRGPIPARLEQGKHAMRLGIGTSSDLSTRLSERWRNLGKLRVKGVISEPMEFKIEPYAESTCDEKIGLTR